MSSILDALRKLEQEKVEATQAVETDFDETAAERDLIGGISVARSAHGSPLLLVALGALSVLAVVALAGAGWMWFRTPTSAGPVVASQTPVGPDLSPAPARAAVVLPPAPPVESAPAPAVEMPAEPAQPAPVPEAAMPPAPEIPDAAAAVVPPKEDEPVEPQPQAPEPVQETPPVPAPTPEPETVAKAPAPEPAPRLEPPAAKEATPEPEEVGPVVPVPEPEEPVVEAEAPPVLETAKAAEPQEAPKEEIMVAAVAPKPERPRPQPAAPKPEPKAAPQPEPEQAGEGFHAQPDIDPDAAPAITTAARPAEIASSLPARDVPAYVEPATPEDRQIIKVNMPRPANKTRPYDSAVINLKPVFLNEIIPGTNARLVKVREDGVEIVKEDTGKRYYVPF